LQLLYGLYNIHINNSKKSNQNYKREIIHLKINEMKKKLFNVLTAGILFLMPNVNFAQAPTLGTTADFVIFTTAGSLGNSGISQLTGNVGTNDHPTSVGFGNVNGIMDYQNGASGQAATDLLSAYNQLNATVSTATISTLLGNNATLAAGVYYVPGAASLNLNLTLNGNANAVFIFKIQGALSTNSNSKIILTGGALACNVFWKVEGLINMTSGTTMRGTVISNNGAITMGTGDTLEGRIMTTSGAINVDGILGYTPTGCGSATLVGPNAPNLATTACYAVFSGNGAVTNTDTTHITGDVGTNVTLTTGYTASDVNGMIHPIPDASTAQCAADLGNVYTYLNTLTPDIELLYPAQFGRNLVLTPHTYVMNAATTFTDSLYLNARGDANAVFVIQINGALSTSTYAKVLLVNGAQAKNVYWLINGAVAINNFSIFNGTIVANNGAVSLNKGTILKGRAFTTNGTLTTDSVNVVIPTTCSVTGIASFNTSTTTVGMYPNPFANSIVISVNNASETNNNNLRIYDVLGAEVMNIIITKQTTTIETNHLPSGVYFYKVIDKSGAVHSGKLISQQ
jgi:hypothetical protein